MKNENVDENDVTGSPRALSFQLKFPEISV